MVSLKSFKDFNSYEINYPELKRKLTIDFEKKSPYQIIKWEETDLNNPDRVTIATKIKSLKLPYWHLNHLEDEQLRDSLGIK